MSANIAIAQLILSTFIVSVTLIWGIFRYRRGNYRRRDRFSKLQAYLLWIFGGLVGMSTFYPLSFLYTEHLWYENLGYEGIFWRIHRIRVGFLRALLHPRCGVHEHQRCDSECPMSRIECLPTLDAYPDLLVPSDCCLYHHHPCTADGGPDAPAR